MAAKAKDFIATLSRIGYPGANKLEESDVEWMFDKEPIKLFLDWFCNSVGGTDLQMDLDQEAKLLEESCAIYERELEYLQQRSSQLNSQHYILSTRLSQLEKQHEVLMAQEAKVQNDLLRQQAECKSLGVKMASLISSAISKKQQLDEISSDSDIALELFQADVQPYLHSEKQFTDQVLQFANDQFASAGHQDLEDISDFSKEMDLLQCAIQKTKVDKALSSASCRGLKAQIQALEAYTNDDTLKDLASDANLENLLKHTEEQLCDVQKSISRTVSKEIQGFVAGITHDHFSSVMAEAYTNKLKGMESYLSKQQVILNQLVNQFARYRYLQIGIGGEHMKYQSLRSVEAAAAQAVEKEWEAFQKRKAVMTEMITSSHTPKLDVVDNSDEVNKKLFSILSSGGDSDNPDILVLRYSDIKESSARMRSQHTSLQHSLSNFLQSRMEDMALLEKKAKLLERAILGAESCGMMLRGQSILAPRETRETMICLRSSLRDVQETLKHLVEQYHRKKPAFENPLKKRERKLYVKFWIDPDSFIEELQDLWERIKNK